MSERKKRHKKDTSKDESFTDELELINFTSNIANARRGRARHYFARTLLIILLALFSLLVLVKYTPFAPAVDMLRIFRGGKYLILLSNNSELRPSGGFIGSFAVANFKGVPKIEYIETNIYKKDNQFTSEHYVDMPEPLQEALGKDTSWQLHDCNWSADFPEAAQTCLWFYNQEYGEQLDGVVEVNATAIQSLLGLTGPIQNSDGSQITEQNFFASLGQSIEKDYWDDPRNESINEPKTILKNLFPELKSKAYKLLLTRDLWHYVLSMLAQKDIVIYSNNTSKQDVAKSNGWTSDLATKSNFLLITNATVGTKTSLAIDQSVTYDIDTISKTATITLNRKHNGITGQYDGGDNINYTNIYLPKGTTLESARLNDKDIKVDTQTPDEYVSYGFWTTLLPSQSLEAQLAVTLPSNLPVKPLDILKQIGSRNEQITVVIDGKTVKRAQLQKDVIVD